MRNEWESLSNGGGPIEPLPYGAMLGKTGLILPHRLNAEEWEAVGSVTDAVAVNLDGIAINAGCLAGDVPRCRGCASQFLRPKTI